MENTLTLENHLDDFVNEDHFEYVDHRSERIDSFPQNNADIFDYATKVPVYGKFYDIGRNVSQTLGNIFGQHEDKATTGFEQFIASGGGALPYYPTKQEMLDMMTKPVAPQPGLPGGRPWDKAEPAAVSQSYNPNDGTWQRGDWRFKVVSNSPITVKSFKGKPVNPPGNYTFVSTVSAKPQSGGMQSMATTPTPQAQTQVSSTPSPQASPTGGAPSMNVTPQAVIPTQQGSVPVAQIQSAVQQLQAQGVPTSDAHEQIAQHLGTTPDVIKDVHVKGSSSVHAKHSATNDTPSGAASLTSIVPQGGMTTYLIIGAVALVSIILIVVAMKK